MPINISNIEESGKIVNSKHAYGSIADALYRIILVFSSVSVDRDQWLTPREIEFYIPFVITTLLDYDVDSAESDPIFEAIFGKHRKYDRKGYINKITNKNWARELGGEIELPEVFKGINIDKGLVQFNLKVEWGT